ncbi:MAG: type II toxin-antitoxin system HipA family toxin, partial [Nitriliruptoraceae bacterium]
MITREVVALLDGHPVATVSETSGRTRLVYADSHRTADATPLSVSLPVQLRDHTHDKVSAFLWGLLPDDDRVLRRWARNHQVSASSPVALLSSPVGADCAGAVQFASPDRVEQLTGRAGTIDWLTEAEVADKLRGLAADGSDWLGERVKAGQFSLAGAQAKLALRFELSSGRWGTPHGSEPTTHILKPGISDIEGHALNEHLCLATARRLGLVAAASSIERFDDQIAVAIRRFDRTPHGGRLVRVHQEDMCQALGVHPDAKYEQDGGPSVADIVELLRTLLPSTEAADATARFLDGQLFNWLIGGTDGHAKNHGILLSGAQVRLAPLYDIASMLPYEPDPWQLRLAMKVGGEYRFKVIHAHHWYRLAGRLSVDPEQLLGRAQQLATQLPDALSEAHATAVGAQPGAPLPPRMVDSISAWSQRCLKGLVRFRT